MHRNNYGGKLIKLNVQRIIQSQTKWIDEKEFFYSPNVTRGLRV